MFYRKHARVTLDCGDILITKQSHKAECDIYTILKNYQKTGVITHVQSARPTYTDLPSDLDLQSSLNTISIAEQAFSNLPSRVRDHFSNDPLQFLAAFHDKDQRATLEAFGLLRATPLPPTTLEGTPTPIPASPKPS